MNVGFGGAQCSCGATVQVKVLMTPLSETPVEFFLCAYCDTRKCHHCHRQVIDSQARSCPHCGTGLFNSRF